MTVVQSDIKRAARQSDAGQTDMVWISDTRRRWFSNAPRKHST